MLAKFLCNAPVVSLLHQPILGCNTILVGMWAMPINGGAADLAGWNSSGCLGQLAGWTDLPTLWLHAQHGCPTACHESRTWQWVSWVESTEGCHTDIWHLSGACNTLSPTLVSCTCKYSVLTLNGKNYRQTDSQSDRQTHTQPFQCDTENITVATGSQPAHPHHHSPCVVDWDLFLKRFHVSKVTYLYVKFVMQRNTYPLAFLHAFLETIYVKKFSK